MFTNRNIANSASNYNLDAPMGPSDASWTLSGADRSSTNFTLTAKNQSTIENLHYQCAKDLLDFSSNPDNVPFLDDKNSITCKGKKKTVARSEGVYVLKPIGLVKDSYIRIDCRSPLLHLTIPLQALGLGSGEYICALHTTNAPDTKYRNETYKLDTMSESVTFTFSKLRVPLVNFTLKFNVFCKSIPAAEDGMVAAFEQYVTVLDPTSAANWIQKPAATSIQMPPLLASSIDTVYSSPNSASEDYKLDKMSVRNIINHTTICPVSFRDQSYPISEAGSDQSMTIIQDDRDLESISNDGSVSTKTSYPKQKPVSNIFSSQINLNAFAIFRAERTAVLKQLPEKLTFKELQTKIGREWRGTDQTIKAQYRQKATRDLVPSNSLLEQSMKRKIGVKAFSIFRNQLATKIEKMSFVQLQREAGRRWKSKTCEEKQKYLEKARDALTQ